MAGYTWSPRPVRVIEARPERRHERPPQRAGGRRKVPAALVSFVVIVIIAIALYLALGRGGRRPAEAAAVSVTIQPLGTEPDRNW